LVGGSYLIHVKRGKISSKIELPIWKFTDVGRELLELVRKERDDDYLEKVGRFFVTKGGEAVIGMITERLPDGTVKYTAEKQVELQPAVPALPENTSSEAGAKVGN
jgi:hypothetical protein